MKYTELVCNVNSEIESDILVAYLAQYDYESFVNESPNILKAYIKSELFNVKNIETIISILEKNFSFDYSFAECPEINWNQKWEENYEPVLIDKKCLVRAPFHKTIKNIKYDIIIQPKMSFGTAHHETTYQILSEVLTMNCKNKSFLDMGCGTGVIAILAAFMGATPIWAIDNDEWAYNNSEENIERNNFKDIIKLFKGDASLLKNICFDIIVANINRNILLEDIPNYSSALNKNGSLLLSGFYTEDLNVIKQKATKSNLTFNKYRTENNWAVAVFTKK